MLSHYNKLKIQKITQEIWGAQAPPPEQVEVCPSVGCEALSWGRVYALLDSSDVCNHVA